MGDAFGFVPRLSEAAPIEPAPMTEVEIRSRLGEALQTALDAADHIIAVLDRMGGDTDREDGGEAEPSLAAPENYYGSEVVWLRNNDSGQEAEAPETVFPVVVAADRAVIPLAPLPSGGSGNVVAAAGVALLKMIATF